jgi:hypothetical protein
VSSDNLVKLTISGKIGTAQTWSIGLWGVAPGPTVLADLQAFAALARGHWHTFWTGAYQPVISDDTSYSTLHCSRYPSGTTSADLIAQDLAAPVIGSSSLHQPPQLCLVASLRTGLSGRENRGRVYLPLTGLPNADLSDHQVAASVVDAINTDFTAFLIALDTEAIGPDTWTTSVGNPRAAHASHPVIQVVMDSKIDTQRRRTDKFLPSHVSVLAG